MEKLPNGTRLGRSLNDDDDDDDDDDSQMETQSRCEAGVQPRSRP